MRKTYLNMFTFAFDIFSPPLARFLSSADEINDKFIGKKVFPRAVFSSHFDGGKSLQNESSVWRLAAVNGPAAKKGNKPFVEKRNE
jgi:hypothetical protein